MELHRDATLRLDPDDAILVQRGARTLRLSDAGQGVAAALDQLRVGATRSALLAATADGFEAPARLAYYLQLLERNGCIARRLQVDGTPIATAEDFAAECSPPFAPGETYALSRFAYMRAEHGTLRLETPLSRCVITVHDGRAAALVQRLAADMRGDDPVELPAGAGRLFLSLLWEARMLVVAGAPEPQALRTWEFHDLLFHAQSREGRRERPSGGTYRFVGELPASPALAPPRDSSRYSLPKPDLLHIMRTDPPFAAVQELRRSIRGFGADPITQAQLGEFLFRVARVTHTLTITRATPGGPIESTMAHRPYPGGGGLYELEIYPLVARADGIASGLYRYDPLAHALEQVATPDASTDALVTRASRGTGIPVGDVQVLLVIAARFARFTWKYEAMAYAAILKNVGVLYQTMYLAATAMGLAPCAVGSGDSDAFAAAAGTDYLAETSVGEFILGSCANGEQQRPSDAA